MGKLALLLALLLLCASDAKGEGILGEERVVAAGGIGEIAMLFDGEEQTPQHIEDGAWLWLDCAPECTSMYLIFHRPYGALTLADRETHKEMTVDTQGMLHFFLDLEECFGYSPQAVTISFSAGEGELNEVYLFPPGEVPDRVQRWQQNPGEADLLLLSTHGDDEQLFFAGLLPYYAGERGYRVQVVYFTDHRNLTSHRVHEMLDGLWAVGVRDYPVFGPFDDYYTFDLEDAYRYYEENGISRQDLLSFVTEQLRRFRPLVAVGHDLAGEYGHGMHQLTADLLTKAIPASADPETFPETAEEYGPWQVPKTYLHLYGEKEIVMDWDIPLIAFGGMTAFEVSRDRGFPCHKSQVADFAWYYRGADRAADVGKYSPCRYGLYNTAVGEDTGAGDFFEHLEDYRQPPPETEPTQPETVPEQTQPEPTQPVERPKPEEGKWERNWLLLPALGTAVLTLLTATISVPASKRK